MTCRMTRQDDGTTWVCWCGWFGSDPQEHLGFRAWVFTVDAGGIHITPDEGDEQ